MDTFEIGALVLVRCYGGETATRRVAKDDGKRRLIVCSEREYRAAIEAQREPDGIGFLRSDVRAVESSRVQ